MIKDLLKRMKLCQNSPIGAQPMAYQAPPPPKEAPAPPKRKWACPKCGNDNYQGKGEIMKCSFCGHKVRAHRIGQTKATTIEGGEK